MERLSSLSALLNRSRPMKKLYSSVQNVKRWRDGRLNCLMNALRRERSAATTGLACAWSFIHSIVNHRSGKHLQLFVLPHPITNLLRQRFGCNMSQWLVHFRVSGLFEAMTYRQRRSTPIRPPA